MDCKILIAITIILIIIVSIRILLMLKENFTLIKRKRPMQMNFNKGIYPKYNLTYCGHPYHNPKTCVVPQCDSIASEVARQYGYKRCIPSN